MSRPRFAKFAVAFAALGHRWTRFNLSVLRGYAGTSA